MSSVLSITGRYVKSGSSLTDLRSAGWDRPGTTYFVWGLDKDNFWVGTSNGLLHCLSGVWRLHPEFKGAVAASGVSVDDVWFVFGENVADLAVHWDGSAFLAVTIAGLISPSYLHCAEALGSSEVYLGGVERSPYAQRGQGVIYKWDGSTFSLGAHLPWPVPGAPPTTVWAMATQPGGVGIYYLWGGGSWSDPRYYNSTSIGNIGGTTPPAAPGMMTVIRSIACTATGVWVGGCYFHSIGISCPTSTQVTEYTGGSWVVRDDGYVNAGTRDDCANVYGGQNGIWTGDYGYASRRWNGASWDLLSGVIPRGSGSASATYRQILVLSDATLAVNDNQRVLRLDEGGFVLDVDLASFVPVGSACASGGSVASILLTSDSQSIWKKSGSALQPNGNGPSRLLRFLGAAALGVIWESPDGSLALCAAQAGSSYPGRCLLCSTGTSVPPVGSKWRWGINCTTEDDHPWELTAPVTSGPVNVIFGLDATHVWVLCRYALFFFNGTHWGDAANPDQLNPAFAVQTFPGNWCNGLKVWPGTGGTFSVVVGDANGYLHTSVNGGAWVTSSAHTDGMGGLDGVSPTDLWVECIGARTVRRWNGSAFSDLPAYIQSPIKVSVASSTDVLILCYDGTTWHWDGAAWTQDGEREQFYVELDSTSYPAFLLNDGTDHAFAGRDLVTRVRRGSTGLWDDPFKPVPNDLDALSVSGSAVYLFQRFRAAQRVSLADGSRSLVDVPEPNRYVYAGLKQRVSYVDREDRLVVVSSDNLSYHRAASGEWTTYALGWTFNPYGSVRPTNLSGPDARSVAVAMGREVRIFRGNRWEALTVPAYSGSGDAYAIWYNGTILAVSMGTKIALWDTMSWTWITCPIGPYYLFRTGRWLYVCGSSTDIRRTDLLADPFGATWETPAGVSSSTYGIWANDSKVFAYWSGRVWSLTDGEVSWVDETGALLLYTLTGGSSIARSLIGAGPSVDLPGPYGCVFGGGQYGRFAPAYGQCPRVETSARSSVEIDSIFIVARNVLLINLTDKIASNKDLMKLTNFEVTNLSGGNDGIVRKVLPTYGSLISMFFVNVEELVYGKHYRFTIKDQSIFDQNGMALGELTTIFLMHKTKVDLVIDNIAGMYNKKLGSTVHAMIEAMMMSDEKIGGDF